MDLIFPGEQNRFEGKEPAMGKDWKNGKKDDKGDGDDPKLKAKVVKQRTGSHDDLDS